jgi:addiction module HigA family antidote
VLVAAHELVDLRMPPGNHLEALKGDLEGFHSIRINEIVRGKRGVTPDTAWRFAQAFGTTPEFWMNLQSNYDLVRSRPVQIVERIHSIAG